ncbi:MAG: hypothetical protein K2W96_11315 [Gemmataceae bacterium]|nr:hypothetical protein [Gemmataceae bacterium]
MRSACARAESGWRFSASVHCLMPLWYVSMAQPSAHCCRRRPVIGESPVAQCAVPP